MRYRHKEPHGLTNEERDSLAKKRGLRILADLPNKDGYEFYGFAIDGWRFDCIMHRTDKGTYVIIGAFYLDLIGWKPKHC